jgi:hypothetical protein
VGGPALCRVARRRGRGPSRITTLAAITTPRREAGEERERRGELLAGLRKGERASRKEGCGTVKWRRERGTRGPTQRQQEWQLDLSGRVRGGSVGEDGIVAGPGEGDRRTRETLPCRSAVT